MLNTIVRSGVLYGAILCCVGFLFAPKAFAEQATRQQKINYIVEFLPATAQVKVRIQIPRARWLKQAKIMLTQLELIDPKANGELRHLEDQLIWTPPRKNAELSYFINLNSARANGGYDAFITSSWALLRGEDILPGILTRKTKGVHTEVYLDFVLPNHWTSVNTGWPRVAGNQFLLSDQVAALPRAGGWMIAGELGTRHDKMGSSAITISAPKGHDFRQMETLAFLSMVWPQIEKAFVSVPQKLLITGASDPMWRGGLSSPNALYLHSDRPLVSENGTSTLLHELTHVITGIHADKQTDWFVEGLAEYYSVEFLFRAGAYTAERKKAILTGLSGWGQSVKRLTGKVCSGKSTARAAVLIAQLDEEILQCSQGQSNIDHLTRAVIGNKTVTLVELQTQFKRICGADSKLLRSKLLH